MKDAQVKRWSKAHRVVFRLTNGLIGHRLVNNEMLLLSTTGRKTGSTHTVPLLYLEGQSEFVVIASYGGRKHHPDWYLNLESDPDVVVEIRGARIESLARTASSPERDQWWPKIVDAYAGYGEYQSRTERQIPVVFLKPRPDHSDQR